MPRTHVRFYKDDDGSAVMKKNKTSDAIEILDDIIGDDLQLRKMIAEQRINSHVAQIIYDARTSAGFFQSELARMIGTSQSTIARLEDADYQGHSLTMLKRIASALGKGLIIEFVDTDSKTRTKKAAIA